MKLHEKKVSEIFLKTETRSADWEKESLPKKCPKCGGKVSWDDHWTVDCDAPLYECGWSESMGNEEVQYILKKWAIAVVKDFENRTFPRLHPVTMFLVDRFEIKEEDLK